MCLVAQYVQIGVPCFKVVAKGLRKTLVFIVTYVLGGWGWRVEFSANVTPT